MKDGKLVIWHFIAMNFNTKTRNLIRIKYSQTFSIIHNEVFFRLKILTKEIHYSTEK